MGLRQSAVILLQVVEDFAPENNSNAGAIVAAAEDKATPGLAASVVVAFMTARKRYESR